MSHLKRFSVKSGLFHFYYCDIVGLLSIVQKYGQAKWVCTGEDALMSQENGVYDPN